MSDPTYGPNTESVHAGYHIETLHGSVAPPIYQTSTFAFTSVAQGAARFAGKDKGFIYTRMGNPPQPHSKRLWPHWSAGTRAWPRDRAWPRS